MTDETVRHIPLAREEIRCIAYCNDDDMPLYYLTNKAILYAPELRPTDVRYRTMIREWIPTPRNFVLVPNDQAVDVFYTSWDDFYDHYVDPIFESDCHRALDNPHRWEYLGLVVTFRHEDRRWLVELAVLENNEPKTIGEPWLLYTNDVKPWSTSC